jgi:NAD(P)-dependent dehydrogenase (short-subunit alcohol dehydrogenase family)
MPKPIDADLSGKVMVVTGANSGIGKAASAALSAMGATVVMVCRSQERGEAAMADIRSATADAQLELACIDLSDLASVRTGAAAIAERHPAIHSLVNNAAVWMPDRRENATGTELMWATNVLGPFLLTERLMPSLRAAAPARIVNLTSALSRGLNIDDPEFKDRPYAGMTAYAQSKQANRMWTYDLAQRGADVGITANAVHPGGVGTNLGRYYEGWFGKAFSFWGKWLARTPERGADSAVWLAASPDAAGVSGAYVVDRRVRRCPHRDPETIARLRTVCLEATAG